MKLMNAILRRSSVHTIVNNRKNANANAKQVFINPIDSLSAT